LSDKYGYRYKPYLGRVLGKIKWGPTVFLAPPDASMSEVWLAYEQLTSGPKDTVGWLLNLYRDSERFKELSPKSQKDYSKAIEKLIGAPVGAIKFGDAKLTQVKKQTVRSYLDAYPSPVAANRQIAVLKSAWNWTLERHDVPENPCLGVRLNRESARDRYVTDDEMKGAMELAPPPIQQMMELAYLLRARYSEVLNLTTDDVSDTHVTLIRLKGSEGELCALSERLSAAVSDVRADPYICHRYTESGFSSAWRRLMAKVDNPFTFHDLKAKGISDHQNNHSGHRSPAMRKTYVRTLQEVPATR
jgi:integrase